MKRFNILLVVLVGVLGFLLFTKDTDIEYIKKTNIVYRDTVIKGVSDTVFIEKIKPYKVTEIRVDTVYMDSIAMLKKLLDFNRLRSYKINHKDSLITITANVNVLGKLQDSYIYYDLKDITLKNKETVVEKIKTPTISLFGGVDVNTNSKIGVHLGVQNKKNIFQVGLFKDNVNIRYSRVLFSR